MTGSGGETIASFLRKTNADGLIRNALNYSNCPLRSSLSQLVALESDCRERLDYVHNNVQKIDGNTTGTIVERFCEAQLICALGRREYTTFGQDMKWIGDFSVRAYPLAIIMSVKSIEAKERLIASGLSNSLVPTIGYGWFRKAEEFKESRCRSLKVAGFGAIYMPGSTLADVENPGFLNVHNKPLLRSLDQLSDDLKKAVIPKSRVGRGLVHAFEL